MPLAPLIEEEASGKGLGMSFWNHALSPFKDEVTSQGQGRAITAADVDAVVVPYSALGE